MAQGGQDIFVSTATTKELGVVLDSHNAVAQKLVDFQQQLEALKQGHEEAQKAAAEKQAQEQERQATASQKQDEEQKQVTEQLEGLKAQLAELGKSQGTSDEKLAALEDSTATGLKSLQLAIDELGTSQAELKTRLIPKWEAELSLQMKKLDKDIQAVRQSSEAGAEKLSRAASEQEEKLLAACAAVESSLRPHVDEAAQRLGQAEVDLKKLHGDLDAVAAEGQRRSADLAGELSNAVEQVRDFATNQDKAHLADIKDAHGRKIEMLEGALRQADYERLAFTDRATKELASLAKDVEKLSGCDDRREADVAELWKSLEQREKEHQTNLEKVVKEFRTEVVACESRTAEVVQGCTVNMQRQDAGLADLLRRLDAEVKRLEEGLQAQATTVVASIRSDEGARLRALEVEVTQLARQRQELLERLDQEGKDRKAEVEGCAGGAEKRVAAVELVANARFESVRRALDELVAEFQGYVKTENARSMDVARLEALVRALEVRVWPWRNGAKERGSSPDGPSAANGHPPWEDPADWRDWIRTKRPVTARPATARRAEPKDPLSGLAGSPVGTAMTAVRSARPGGERSERAEP